MLQEGVTEEEEEEEEECVCHQIVAYIVTSSLEGY
jgi:hypothetical protein